MSTTTTEQHGAVHRERGAKLPEDLAAASWAKCTRCRAVREVSKYRPDGPLHCPHCGCTRLHEREWSFDWDLESTWLAKIMLSADVLVGLSPGRNLDDGRPAAVEVGCRSLERPAREWQDATPMRLEVALHPDITPWGLPRALKQAWQYFGNTWKWTPNQWDRPSHLGWMLTGEPGIIDPAYRVGADYLAELFMVGAEVTS